MKKGTTQIINKTYEFNSDAAVKKETDNLNAKFDRSYEYDHLSRMTEARTGAEARGQTDSAFNIPYKTSYQYDAFNHQNYMSYKHFAQGPINTTTTYQNNRISSANYDNDGRLLVDTTLNNKSYEYNAAGQLGQTNYEYYDTNYFLLQHEIMTYDGDGYLNKIRTTSQENEDPVTTETTYRIRSTVLGGQVVFENEAFVHASGTQIATQGTAANSTRWTHKDSNIKSIRTTINNGYVLESEMVELDVDGKSVGFTDPGLGFPPPSNDLFQSENPFSSIRNGQFVSYSIDGISVPRDHFAMVLEFYSGGRFGLLEWQARMRVRDYSVRVRGENNRIYERFYATQAEAASVARSFGQNTIYRNIVVNDSWAINSSLIQQTQQSRGDTPEVIAQKALNEASARLLTQGKCRTAIEDLIRKAALQKYKDAGGDLKDLASPEAMASFHKSFTAEAVMSAINSASPIYMRDTIKQEGGDSNARASITRSGGVLTLTFYAGFYGEVYSGKGGIRVNNEKQEDYVDYGRDLNSQALSIIHEAVHAFGYSDEFIGRIIKGKDKDLTKAEGSKALNEYVEKHCK